MRIHAILASLLFAGLAFAHGHTALNGTWTLVPDKSDYAGERTVQSGSVTIDEREGNVTVSRSFVYEGDNQAVFYSDMTDGANHATIHSGRDLKSKTSWDHDTLKVTTTDAGAVTVERYTPGPDGTMMVNVLRPDHKSITLVFERK